MGKERYNVFGMSCAACSSAVERAVQKIDGVTSVSVNLLTNSMNVEGDVTSDAVENAVKKAGYSAERVIGNSRLSDETSAFAATANDNRNTVSVALHGKANFSTSTTQRRNNRRANPDNPTRILIRSLIQSSVVLLCLMYVSMGNVMYGFPLPQIFSNNPIGIALVEAALSFVVLLINKRFFVNGTKALFRLSPNMDSLVALGSGISFIYSLCELFLMTVYVRDSHSEMAHHLLHNLYFESAAMILTLITIGKTLESYSKGKTTDALKKLMKLMPKTAVVLRNGKEVVVDISSVKVGDEFVVRAGQVIPVDGVIVEGNASVDESTLTGESIPVDKKINDSVMSPAINLSGMIVARATKVGEDTAFAKVIQMVSDSSATKAPVSKAADKVAGVFVPVVICIALVTFVVWKILGVEVAFALERAISVLVVSCPCALGLATPVAIMVGNGVGALHGVLFKNATALEQTGKANVVVFDKTGTITKGEMAVTYIWTTNPLSDTSLNLLKVAYALEKCSLHPLAKVIARYVEGAVSEKSIESKLATNFEELPGLGVKGILNEKEVFGGNFGFISQKCEMPKDAISFIEKITGEGKTPLCFCEDKKFLGIIAVSDTVKETSSKAIEALKSMGIETVMLTGDNERTATAIGKQVGVDKIIAGVLPSGKVEAVKNLLEKNKTVIMVGDGINDAPALSASSVGIAVGAGSDIAIDSAQVVLVKNDLLDVVNAIKLSRKVLRNIHENLFWAFCYNIVGIPLAAGVWYHSSGLSLTPMFGSLAMSISSFIVVMNALRLNLFKFDIKLSGNRLKHSGDNMEKTIIIKGMMCSHCQAHVTEALEKLEGVKADVDFKKGQAIVKSAKEFSNDELTKAVTDAGYEVIKIK